jgi:hypothetical protein
MARVQCGYCNRLGDDGYEPSITSTGFKCVDERSCSETFARYIEACFRAAYILNGQTLAEAEMSAKVAMLRTEPGSLVQAA